MTTQERTRESMTTDEKLVGLLKSAPFKAVVIYREGGHYKAAVIDAPREYPEQSSECRTFPEEAIDRLHEKLVADAEAQVAVAGEHLGRLMTRIIPKERPAPAQPESVADE
jgi:hypothetical protein